MLNKKRFATLCAAGVFMVMCSAASAQDGPVGSLQMGYDSLSVMPAVSYEEMRMTISGEGVYLQKRYGAGEMTSLDTSQLPDGMYKYEIIASPEVDKAAMAKADGNEALERKLEQQEKARTHIQTGSFQVIGGEIQPADTKQETLATRSRN